MEEQLLILYKESCVMHVISPLYSDTPKYSKTQCRNCLVYRVYM